MICAYLCIYMAQLWHIPTYVVTYVGTEYLEFWILEYFHEYGRILELFGQKYPENSRTPELRGVHSFLQPNIVPAELE